MEDLNDEDGKDELKREYICNKCGCSLPVVRYVPAADNLSIKCRVCGHAWTEVTYENWIKEKVQAAN